MSLTVAEGALGSVRVVFSPLSILVSIRVWRKDYKLETRKTLQIRRALNVSGNVFNV